MNKVYIDFLKLLNNGLYDLAETVDCKIEDVEFEAKNHICIPFIYKGAKNINLNIPQVWNNHMVISTMRNQHNLQIQQIVLRQLADAGIKCAILKGCSLSICYNEPMLRTLGDIDILVSPCDYERAIDILCGDEYEDESHEGHTFHYKYTLHDVPIEIHKQVSEYTSAEYGKTIEKKMSGALDNILYKHIDEFEFPSLSNEYQASTLLLHTQRHFFENRLPIKMLCDWAMFVRSVPSDEWNNTVVPFVREIGLEDFCNALTYTVNIYLHAECEEKLTEKVPEKIAEAIILEFLNNGVIADKNSLSQEIATRCSQKMDSGSGKIISLFKFMNDIARKEFRLARISRVFLPLFWIYIPLRYVARVISGKRTGLSLNAFNKTVERKGYIIEELKLKD